MTVSLTLDGVIARLTLERPEVLNALDRATATGLESALERLEASHKVLDIRREDGRRVA